MLRRLRFLTHHWFSHNHVLWQSRFSHISTKHPKPQLMVVFVCLCRSPQALPGTAPASASKLARVVMGTFGRSHVKFDENIEKIISIVFSQTHRFTGKCWLAPCVLPHGSTKRTHPDRSDACTYFGKIELFSTDFAKKVKNFQNPPPVQEKTFRRRKNHAFS